VLFAPWSVGPFFVTLAGICVFGLTAQSAAFGVLSLPALVIGGLGIIYSLMQWIDRAVHGQAAGASYAFLRFIALVACFLFALGCAMSGC
jgi:hypothetical protein